MEKQRQVTLFYHRGSGSLESMKTEDLSLQMFDDPDHDVRFSLIKARRKAKIESMQNPFILERKNRLPPRHSLIVNFCNFRAIPPGKFIYFQIKGFA
jgi:hypothetical protein